MAYTIPTVESCLYFMRNEDRHQHEKPYALRFVAETDLPQTNFVLEPHEDVVLHDMRGIYQKFTIEENGFTILKLPCKIPYEHYDDPRKVVDYLHVVEDVLKEHLGAARVEVFRHSIRKRHPDFPLSTGISYSYDQPTSVAHVDTTPEYTLEEVKMREKEGAGQVPSKRIQWINVWKPLRGPLNDWPLAVCDTKSVNATVDYEPTDLLFPRHVTENFQVHYSPNFKWYYLSNQTEDEMIVFKQSDTDKCSSPGVAHSSFFNPHAGVNEPPRESIEARALVFYET